MTSESTSPFQIDLQAAALRLGQVERADGMSVVLPASYGKRRRTRYPLVILPHAAQMTGSVIEMTRLMAQTRELREAIFVVAEGGRADLAAIEQTCRARYRASQEPARIVAATQLPQLVDELRQRLGTGLNYGDNVVPLKAAWLMHALRALAPAIRLLKPAPRYPADAAPRRLQSRFLAREFEVFVSMPAGARGPLPALVVLDANIEFSIVAEAVARRIEAGELAPMAVIGVGTPRREGAFEFSFRRFEELSPPADGYDWNDDLGRIFRGLFALRGQDARERLGRAPDFLRFLAHELLPRLIRELPLDLDDIGLLGHSAGGTFVCYALTQAESPFRRYAAVSPGIGISGSWLMRQSAEASPTRRAQSAFLCLGEAEMGNAFNGIAGIPDTESYAARLRRHPQLDVAFECFPNETHSSVFPLAVERALSLLYAPQTQTTNRRTA